MPALISLLIVLTLSLLITRIATVALTYTGLSREAAQFQARSAFTGVGFTTSESENVVQHPVRRRILMWLMLLGNAGIVTAISSLLLTFINTGDFRGWLLRLLILVTGLFVLWALSVSKLADLYLSRGIEWALRRWTRLDVRDYASLLHLQGNYTVTELKVKRGDWLANRPLAELGLRQEGIVILGIQRANGRYVGAPKGKTFIRLGDTLIVYGRLSLLAELDERRLNLAGEQAHQRAVAEQEQALRKQDSEDAANSY